MRAQKTKGFSLPLHLIFFPAFVFLQFIGENGEPFALTALFSLIFSGLSPLVCGCFYLLSVLILWDFKLLLIDFFQTVALLLGFLLEKNRHEKTGDDGVLFPFLSLAVALTLFVVFSPFIPYELPSSFGGFFSFALTQKISVAFVIFLFSATSLVGVKALLFKLLKCRFSGEELCFSLLFLLVVGLGCCRFLGLYAYLGIAFLTLLVYTAVTKDASVIFASFLLSLPPALVHGLSVERFFFYGVALFVFSRYGRLASVFALFSVTFFYGFLDGAFLVSSNLLLPVVLSASIPAILFILCPTAVLRKMEWALIFYKEKHLPRVAINRNRSAIGERLFEISGVFREIQSAFLTLGGNEAQENAKAYICRQTTATVCQNCDDYKTCLHKNRDENLYKLVDIGCAKGKVSLIDVPTPLASVCARQSDLLFFVNGQIADYHKYMLEAENAAAGRELLARQAQGVSEILKNLALEQSKPVASYTEKEKQLSIAFLKAGVVCSEILVSGEEGDFTLSLVSFGEINVKKIGKIASEYFNLPMIVSEKIALSKNKFSCILKRRPRLDAAFGVATRTKAGETKSGDTHSVVKIDERKFMVALSDGMGSGEYAKQISESTIALLESFYRAKMPSATVLSTVNKLLTFSKEETFACVDIAIIDLDTGKADVIKIGSPSGFILSGSSLKILESASLPLGILDALRPTSATHVLESDDVLLFLSDGITSAFPSTSDLYEILKTVPTSNPQLLADGLLERALSAYGGVAMDDMTIVAVRVFNAC